MAKERIEKDLNEALNKLYMSVVFSGALISISSLLLAFLHKNEIVQDISKIVASVTIGGVMLSLVQVKVLGSFYRKQSEGAIVPYLKEIKEKVVEEIETIKPDIKAQTIQSIEEINTKVKEATQFMIDGIGVLSGAKASGIVNIFPSRYIKTAGTFLTELIAKDMREEKNHIHIIGISLGDYFLDRGVLHQSFLKLLETNPSEEGDCSCAIIQALLVHPQCETLRERARWEAGEEYYQEPAFWDSTTFIETDGAARIAKRLCTRHNKRLEVKLYEQAPTTFVMLTSRYAFIESYSYADRGSNVPMLQVQAGSKLYSHYLSHFQRIWRSAEAVENYSPFKARSGRGTHDVYVDDEKVKVSR